MAYYYSPNVFSSTWCSPYDTYMPMPMLMPTYNCITYPYTQIQTEIAFRNFPFSNGRADNKISGRGNPNVARDTQLGREMELPCLNAAKAKLAAQFGGEIIPKQRIQIGDRVIEPDGILLTDDNRRIPIEVKYLTGVNGNDIHNHVKGTNHLPLTTKGTSTVVNTSSKAHKQLGSYMEYLGADQGILIAGCGTPDNPHARCFVIEN